jgi:Ca2+-binding RTX toxin-like protein
MTRKTKLLAAAAAALAAFPAVASADTTATVNGTSITITDDDAAATIWVDEAGGLITLNGSTDLGGATAAADGTFSLTVNGGGGADEIVVDTANLAAVTLNGDAGADAIIGSPGNDIINGGDDNDVLFGDGGNDRIAGDRGSDVMNGDGGNDVMVWNPGDGSDEMNGGAGGGDDAELNGGNNSENFAASPVNGRVRFERQSPGPFQLDVSADTERLVLDANGGNDTMNSDAATPTAMLLNGGTGNDVLSGGAAADFINGGDDNDELDGSGAGDRLVGDRGGDAMRGGDGDDVMVWNNGDGSDSMDGQNGLDKTEVNGAAAAGDAFVVARNGLRARFDRTNLGPFTLDIGTTELLDVRGGGGDDTFTAQPLTPLAVLAHGEAGNDTLTGADEPDTFFGGVGNDTLNGGAGPDLLDGQDGDDRLLARDGAGDLVRGGFGVDSAQTDAVDIVVDVEAVEGTPPAEDKKAATVGVGKRATIKLKKRRAQAAVRLECPAEAVEGCEGELTIMTAKRYKVLGTKTRLVLGSVAYDLDADESNRRVVRLARSVKRLANRKGKLKVIARTEREAADGTIAQATERMTLKLRKKDR